jgi:hypothetical protein
MGYGSIGGTACPRRTSYGVDGSARANWCPLSGSEHAWFEGRGPMCSLLAFIDDATTRIMALRFAASESAADLTAAGFCEIFE